LLLKIAKIALSRRLGANFASRSHRQNLSSEKSWLRHYCTLKKHWH